MNVDQARRSATIPFSARDVIPVAPPAPPLPAPRPLQRARDAATRFFGYQSRPESPQSSPEEDRHPGRVKDRLASLSTIQNATASHRTGLEINTLAINEKGTHALIGGKEIFKTVKVEGGVCAEETNLRSVIRSTPTHASGKARQAYSIDIADVAWAKGDCGDYVAAATSSGKIILYDLGRAGLQAAQLHEHFRQVHKVTFNPHRGSLLLSGSQDGTVRLWDVRDVRQASTLQSKRKFSGLSDGVRDVKWSPTDGVDFAFGTDSGWIQRWDMRNLKTAKVKIPAHSETCNAIDWHPDGKHIASASSDKTVRIWDFSTNRRQQKASWEIKAPYRVMNARWRPSCEVSKSGGLGARQCTQLVTSYEQDRSVLHVWDFRRPALPFREIYPYATAPTDLLWHSQDLLWTVGREGVFLQSDIQHATKTITKRNLQAFALSSSGELSIATQKRQRNHFLPLPKDQPLLRTQSSSRSESPQRAVTLARSWADDGLDHSFLRAIPLKVDPPRSAPLTRAQSLSGSSLNEMNSTLYLDDALSSKDLLRPRQAAVTGSIPLALDSKVFAFLACNYRTDFDKLAEGKDFLDTFSRLLDDNASCAYAGGLYRTAQTWNIVKGAVISHLKQRAESKQRARLESGHSPRPSNGRTTLVETVKSLRQEQAKSPLSSPFSLQPMSNITHQLALSDAVSSQRTPVSKPIGFDQSSTQVDTAESPETTKAGEHALPPLLSPLPSPLAMVDNAQASPPSKNERELTISNLDGLQKLSETSHIIDRNAMVRRWSVQPKEPLNLDPVDADGVKIRSPRLQRQGSNESFTFLDGSLNSREHSFPSSRGSKGSVPLEMVSEWPSRMNADRSELSEDTTVATEDFDDRPVASPPVPIVQLEGLPTSMSDERIPQEHENGIAGEDSKAAWNGGNHPQPYSPYLHDEALSKRGSQLNELVGQNRQSSQNGATTNGLESNDRFSVPSSSEVDGQLASAALYVPEPCDEDVEEAQPFRLVEMLRELVSYYTGKGDAQTAAYLIIAITPFLPHTQPLPSPEIVALVSAYVDCFAAAGYMQDEIEQILESRFEPLIQSGMQPLQIEAIFAAYHEQLLKQRLWDQGALLRKLTYPMYHSVYEDAVKDNHVHARCGDCHKPIASGMTQLRCESCETKQANCSVCESDESPYEGDIKRPSKLMSTCLVCNHSGHAACLGIWYEEGDGGCPTVGCLCDCVAGSWRVTKTRLNGTRQRAKLHNRVKSDELIIFESNAVERTRSLLVGFG